MSEALSVRIDTTQHYPRASAIRGTVACRDIWNLNGSVQENVDLDPYSGAITCNPIQYNSDWNDDSRVTRYGLDMWTGHTEAWEEATSGLGIATWLHSIVAVGVANRISTVLNFDENCGFLFQAQICGFTNDRVDAFTLEFGQWKWKLLTDGRCQLYKGTTLVHSDIYSKNPLAGSFVEISIMPASNKSLAIRPHRHTGAGIVYRLPDADVTPPEGTSEEDFIPTIIESGVFAVECHDITLKRMQLTQLTYDESLTYQLTSPALYLPTVPLTEQTLSVDFDKAEVFGGAIAAGLWEQVVDTPFVPEGTKYIYRAIFQLTPYAKTTPIVRGLHYEFAAVVPPAMGTPADVTIDVKELTIETGRTAELTEAKIVLRNPLTYNLFGTFNRVVQIQLGGLTLFLGITKESPSYVYGEGGVDYYELTVQGLHRQLSAFSLNQDFEMDGQVHSDMVKLLCQIGGIADANLDIYTSTETLPDTRKPAGDNQTDDGSQFHCKPMDTPGKWIDEICDKTGWIFCDGHLGGDYVLRYIDPLVESTTPVTTFVLDSSLDPTGLLPKLRSWRVQSQAPECNELHVLGCNERGEVMDACYLDLTSQDGLLDPSLRPNNWLGGRVTAAIVIDGTTTPTWLQEISMRIGGEVCNRWDVVRTEGDWPDFLWTGQTVSIYDGGTPADYKIIGLSIRFEQEMTGNIVRRAEYLMERKVV